MAIKLLLCLCYLSIKKFTCLLCKILIQKVIYFGRKFETPLAVFIVASMESK